MMKKTPKILLIFFGSIVAILLIASLLVSPIAKNYIENHDKELIGRELSIGKLRVNLLAGKAKIKELVLFEDDGATPFVQFEKLESRIRWQDLFSEFGNELLEEFVLAGGVVLVVSHDVAPDFNLFAHF